MGELRGLSRWRARYQGIGLDEALINNATEKAGMILIQVERFIRVLSTVVQQVCLHLKNSFILECSQMENKYCLYNYMHDLADFLLFFSSTVANYICYIGCSLK